LLACILGGRLVALQLEPLPLQREPLGLDLELRLVSSVLGGVGFGPLPLALELLLAGDVLVAVLVVGGRAGAPRAVRVVLLGVGQPGIERARRAAPRTRSTLESTGVLI
jgi:hypothetical protein